MKCLAGFFFWLCFLATSLFFTFAYLNILIDGVTVFQISFSASPVSCVCYFSTDGAILVFITWALLTYRLRKKNYILSELRLNMIQPSCGSLVQAYGILGNFCFHHFIKLFAFFAPVLSIIKTRAKYSIVSGT